MPALNALLHAHGVAATFVETSARSGSAERKAHAAVKRSELIVACGGDGTVHQVLQAVALSPAALGVLPLGTANALARNLGLSLDPVKALAQLLAADTRTIPLGRAEIGNRSRFWIAMAGAGPDGALVREMVSTAKGRLGRGVYYAEAARLFATRQFATFTVTYREAGLSAWVRQNVCGMLGARIPDLGGFFTGLTPSASLLDPHLHVQLLRPPAHLSFAAWMAMRTRSPWLSTVDVEEILCEQKAGEEPAPAVYAQLDAEPAGPLPMRLDVVPAALNLLMP